MKLNVCTRAFCAASISCMMLTLAAPTWAAPSPYVLYVNPKAKLMRLKQRLSGRTVWTRTVDDYIDISWSPDRKSVFVFGKPECLVWREGRRVRAIASLGDYDYPMGYRWSSDSLRLLFRVGASGASDIGPEGAGPLYYLDVARGTSSRARLIHDSVWKVRWQDNKTVLFWPFDYTKADMSAFSKLPRRWRAP